MTHLRPTTTLRALAAILTLLTPAGPRGLPAQISQQDLTTICPSVPPEKSEAPLYIVAPVSDVNPPEKPETAAQDLANKAEAFFKVQEPSNDPDEQRVEPPPIGASQIKECAQYPCEVVEERVTEDDQNVIFDVDVIKIKSHNSPGHRDFQWIYQSEDKNQGKPCPKAREVGDPGACRKYAKRVIARKLLEHDLCFHRMKDKP